MDPSCTVLLTDNLASSKNEPPQFIAMRMNPKTNWKLELHFVLQMDDVFLRCDAMWETMVDKKYQK